MQQISVAKQLAPAGQHFEVRGSTFRMKVGRAFVEIDLNLTHEEIHNAKEFIGVVMDKNRRPSRAVISPLPHVNPASTASPRLSEATKFYLDNLSKRKRGSSTLKSYRGTLRILLAVAGDIPISQIDYKVIARFFDQLRWWPRKAMTRLDLRGLTPRQQLEIGLAEGQEAPVAEKTHKAHVAALNAFFGTYLKVDQVPCNPMEIFKQDNPGSKPAKTRFPLAPETLAQIFNPETFEAWAKKYPHRWWIPSIALYTGARVEEIAQLRAADIGVDQGVMCFFLKILEEDQERQVDGMRDKTFKNGASHRVVPIAQPLLDAGILQYVEEVRQAGLTRLFPQLRAGISRKTGELNGSGYSVGHIQQFGFYLREHTDLKKGIGSHAFRHTLSSALHNADQPKAIVASITGHGGGEGEGRYRNTDHYIDAEPPQTLRPKQVRALGHFKPNVVLPSYTPGQFNHCLGPDARLNP